MLETPRTTFYLLQRQSAYLPMEHISCPSSPNPAQPRMKGFTMNQRGAAQLHGAPGCSWHPL